MEGWISIYWVAPVVAWLVAQLIKVFIASLKNEKANLWPAAFLSSGSMPSSHSAITVAILVVVGVLDGINSAVFGVAFVLTAIVIYDALNVRRAVGEQGEVLKALIKTRSFYTALGHQPIEVIAGSLIGLLVACVLLQIL